MEHTQTPLQVGMLLYPGLTLLDLIGPQTAWSWHAKIHLVWKTRDLIVSDSGVVLQPTTTFADCPHDLDILFVPGGFGTAAAMQDRAVLDFLDARAAHARYITSVCSGSLILGAGGVLRGYNATSHWAVLDRLPLFGAEPVDARVVVDRNRITGGGVTAGIDFGLVLLAKLRGEEVARVIQLVMEYDPEPPFQAGSPHSAGPAIVELTRRYMESADLELQQGPQNSVSV